MPRAASVARGGSKRRRTYCLPSCFSSPSVWDPEDLEFPLDSSSLTFLSRLHSRSRTVPVVELAGHGRDGHVEVSGVMQSENAPSLLSPAGNRHKGLMQKLRKEENRSKTIVQPLAQKSLSTRTTKAEHKQSRTSHVSTKYNFRSAPATPHHRLPSPVQTGFRTSNPSTLEPNRPANQGPSPTRSARRLNVVDGLLMLATTLAVMLFFGRLCAVLCNCAWFYLFSCLRPPPSPPPSPATQIIGAEEVDVDSAEYKKRVVLMGLLERNRHGVSGTPMSPMASPAPAKLR